MLSHYSHWRPIGMPPWFRLCGMASGLSVSDRWQLAQCLRDHRRGGVKRPITFERVSGPVPGEQVLRIPKWRTNWCR